MADDEDQELQRRFAALRREEQEATPPFRRVWAAAQTSRRPRTRARFAVAATVAAVVLGLLWLRTGTGPAPESGTSPSIAQWRSPTDFLLVTPGRELLSTVPAIGRPAIPGLGLAMPPPKPSSTPKGGMS